MAKHLYTYVDPVVESHIDRAVEVIRSGGIIAYPTDVNWAFGCDAANVKTLDRIRMLKPFHPKERPFSLICSDLTMVASVANVDSQAYRILRKVLPGSYTILLARNRSLARQIKDKRKIVGIRIPRSPLLLAIVEKFGHPIATTSVPLLQEAPSATPVPARFGFEVLENFGHALDLVIDLGEAVPGLESTIVDLSEGIPHLVRLGFGDPKPFEIEVEPTGA